MMENVMDLSALEPRSEQAVNFSGGRLVPSRPQSVTIELTCPSRTPRSTPPAAKDTTLPIPRAQTAGAMGRLGCGAGSGVDGLEDAGGGDDGDTFGEAGSSTTSSVAPSVA